jgi:hypothetical protein
MKVARDTVVYTSARNRGRAGGSGQVTIFGAAGYLCGGMFLMVSAAISHGSEVLWTRSAKRLEE